MSKKRFRKLLPLVSTLALMLPLLLALASPVSAATITVCASGCDYTTIQAAVDAANDGDVIDVYPGTYNESVDLNGMTPEGDITIRSVNSGGTPTAGAATVNGGAAGPAFETSSTFSGDVTIDGFIVESTSDDGINVKVNSDVVIRDVIADSTDDDGIQVDAASGNVTIEDCTANHNEEQGIRVRDTGGNVTITGCTANDNDEDGIWVYDVAGDVLISNCTANGNGEDGFNPMEVKGTVTIKACIARDNDSGVDLDHLEDADAVLVNGNIICGNAACGVDNLDGIADLNLEGNWWGCDGGPEAAGCDPVCQEDSIPVDYTPWIDTITASAPASVIVGEPAIVSFQFSGGPPAVYLGEGPGDLRGPAPFTVSTDNGTVTGGFINAPDGVMEVTLVPQTEGTATVTVVGPCGLDEQIVLGVQAAAADFVPEPGSVMLLASGLMGLAGYAGLRMRKR